MRISTRKSKYKAHLKDGLHRTELCMLNEMKRQLFKLRQNDNDDDDPS